MLSGACHTKRVAHSHARTIFILIENLGSDAGTWRSGVYARMHVHLIRAEWHAEEMKMSHMPQWLSYCSTRLISYPLRPHSWFSCIYVITENVCRKRKRESEHYVMKFFFLSGLWRGVISSTCLFWAFSLFGFFLNRIRILASI